MPPWHAAARPLLAALVLMATTLAGCAGSPAHAPTAYLAPANNRIGMPFGTEAWRPQLVAALGDPATSDLPDWPRQFDVPPKSFDINGDGVDEIVAQANDTNVYVFDSQSGRVLAVLPTTTPPAWHIERVLNGVEVGVLRPGEPASIVVSDHAAYVAVWRYDPAQGDAKKFAFTKQWEHRLTACHASPGMDSKPALADLEGKKELDILVQTEEEGIYALRPDGTTLWKECWAGGNSAPIAADLNGDGKLEAIFGSDSGFVSVIAGATGVPIWTFDSRAHEIMPASIVVSPTVAELDGVAPMEIVFTAREAATEDPSLFSGQHMAVFAIHQNLVTGLGELLWMKQPEWSNPLSATEIVIQDVDKDGQPDIFGMDWNTIGHYPGDWENLGPAHVFRWTAAGDEVWVREVDAWWSNKQIALGDANGDRSPDLLVNGAIDNYDGIWRLSAKTGTREAFLALDGWKTARGPFELDLHHDGSPEIVLPVEPTDPALARGAILVFNTS